MLSSWAIRRRIVEEARWGVGHEAEIHYAEIRPVPLDRWKNRVLPITTDCSGFVTCCYYAAGARDPNRSGYDGGSAGDEFTGTLLNHLPVISKARAKPGDLLVYGAFPGNHVVMLVENGDDPLLASHGSEGGPILARKSFMDTGFNGQPQTWLRGVPAVHHRWRRPQWRVTGHSGRVIGQARGPLRWILKHPVRYRRAKRTLHFDHI